MCTGFRKPLSIVLALLVILIAGPTLRASTHHVAPSGSREGDGSVQRPIDLQSALRNAASTIKPGDTVLLHGGTYSGSFISTLRGTAEAPIVVRGAEGERVVIDCVPTKPDEQPLFTIQGEHTHFIGFEVTCSAPGRITQVKGSHPPDIRRGGINATGSHLKFINLIVHDTAQGFGHWSGGEGGEIYGCIIYNNGWLGPDRGHGHGIYAQNKAGTKRFVDNVIFNQFSYGIHLYGSDKASLEGFHVEGNAVFNNGSAAGPDRRSPAILIGGGSAAARVAVISNFTYGGPAQFGYASDVLNQDIVIKDNYFAGPVSFKDWQQVEFTGNTVVAPGPLVRWDVRHISIVRTARVQDNSYVRTDSDRRPFAVAVQRRSNTEMSFGQYQTVYNFDDNGRYAGGRPRGVKVFVRPNRHETGRAHVIVYNWDRLDEVEVDLSAAGLKAGQRFELRSVQDPFAPALLAAVYEGKPITVPMTRPVAAARPVGMPEHQPPVTEPEFGVYLLLPASR